jgi:hypothetical protein
MYIEIDCLNKKKEFLLALLDYYLFTGDKIYIQINKGIHLIDKCRMFLKYMGTGNKPGQTNRALYFNNILHLSIRCIPLLICI